MAAAAVSVPPVERTVKAGALNVVYLCLKLATVIAASQTLEVVWIPFALKRYTY